MALLAIKLKAEFVSLLVGCSPNLASYLLKIYDMSTSYP